MAWPCFQSFCESYCQWLVFTVCVREVCFKYFTIEEPGAFLALIIAALTRGCNGYRDGKGHEYFMMMILWMHNEHKRCHEVISVRNCYFMCGNWSSNTPRDDSRNSTEKQSGCEENRKSSYIRLVRGRGRNENSDQDTWAANGNKNIRTGAQRKKTTNQNTFSVLP